MIHQFNFAVAPLLLVYHPPNSSTTRLQSCAYPTPMFVKLGFIMFALCSGEAMRDAPNSDASVEPSAKFSP